MPLIARYKRNPNRIYFAGDFQDGELIRFWWNADKPSACAKGYAWYESIDESIKWWRNEIVNISEIEDVNQ